MELGQFIKMLEKIQASSRGNQVLRVFCAEEPITGAELGYWDGCFLYAKEEAGDGISDRLEEVVMVW